MWPSLVKLDTREVDAAKEYFSEVKAKYNRSNQQKEILVALQT